MNGTIPTAQELYAAVHQALKFGPVSDHNPPGLMADIAIAQVAQLEKLNANLEKIENTLRHNMEVAVIQP